MNIKVSNPILVQYNSSNSSNWSKSSDNYIWNEWLWVTRGSLKPMVSPGWYIEAKSRKCALFLVCKQNRIYCKKLWNIVTKAGNQIKMQRSFKAKVRARVRRQTFAPPQNHRRSSVENVVTNIMRIEDFRNQKFNAIKVTDHIDSTKDLPKRKVLKSDTSETETEPER